MKHELVKRSYLTTSWCSEKFPNLKCSLGESQNNVKSRLWRNLSPTSWSRHRLKSGTVPQICCYCRQIVDLAFDHSSSFRICSACKVFVLQRSKWFVRVSFYTCVTQSEGTQKQSAQTIAMWLPLLLPLAEAIISEIWRKKNTKL